MKALNVIATALLVVGGLNWGLVGICGCNFVELLFESSLAVRVVYYLVGIAAIHQAAWLTLLAMRRIELQK